MQMLVRDSAKRRCQGSGAGRGQGEAPDALAASGDLPGPLLVYAEVQVSPDESVNLPRVQGSAGPSQTRASR